MKYFFILISICLFSCSNPVEERNAKLSEFLIRQKNIQSRMDSFNEAIRNKFPVDTFVVIENDPLGILQVSPEVSEEEQKYKERKDLKILLTDELNSVKFSIDSLSKMK
jgi:hypothetical protein